MMQAVSTRHWRGIAWFHFDELARLELLRLNVEDEVFLNGELFQVH